MRDELKAFVAELLPAALPLTCVVLVIVTVTFFMGKYIGELQNENARVVTVYDCTKTTGVENPENYEKEFGDNPSPP